MTHNAAVDPWPEKGEILVVDDSRENLQLLFRILGA